MDNQIIATIKGEVVKLFTDSYVNKDEKKVTINKAIVLCWVDEEPFKMSLTVPEGENWTKGDEIEGVYKIYVTKNGFLMCLPLK